jgi:hypothetical protein
MNKKAFIFVLFAILLYACTVTPTSENTIIIQTGKETAGSTPPTEKPYPTYTLYPTYTPFPTYTPYPTYTALPTFTPYPTLTPTQGKPTTTPTPFKSSDIGVVTGKLYFPGQGIPKMNVYFENADTHKYFTIPISAGQKYYTATLPSGVYYAYVWLVNFGMSGAYTFCVQNRPCEDHTLKTVTVAAGKTVQGVDMYDWYAPPGTFPLPPGVSITGAIEGIIMYPSLPMPSMTVYARNTDTGETFKVVTQQGQYNFRIDNLPVGGYHVFAWYEVGAVNYIGGAYACMMSSFTCPDHSLVVVVVYYNKTTQANINDWFKQSIVPKP